MYKVQIGANAKQGYQNDTPNVNDISDSDDNRHKLTDS
mgnify:CR=1 FL=1